MRFAKHLVKIGDDFRRNFLDSADEQDKTVMEEDWTEMKVKFCLNFFALLCFFSFFFQFDSWNN